MLPALAGVRSDIGQRPIVCKRTGNRLVRHMLDVASDGLASNLPDQENGWAFQV